MKPGKQAGQAPVASGGKPLSARNHQEAFDHSLMASIISVVSDGQIIAANPAAAQLLGYSKKLLLTRHMEDIFAAPDHRFTLVLMQRSATGQAIENITAVKKDGTPLPCQITSVEFTNDKQIKLAITTLTDRSADLRVQKNIDFRRKKQVTEDTRRAKYTSDAILDRLVALEHQLDQEISAKEQLQSYSRVQKIAFKKEREIETRVKAKEIENAVSEAKEIERTDLGRELHDNVNQLLAASTLYLDIAQKNKTNRELYLKRSAEYTMTAIEEIRKLTKGLIKDVLDNQSLQEAIDEITHDIMEVHPIRISWSMDKRIHGLVNARFNLNVFRIIQEQLNNIIKHTKATQASISLAVNKKNIRLTIADNGPGFDVKKKNSGIGLLNIKSRAENFRGTARFISKSGAGCTLTVLFPANQAKPLLPIPPP